MKDLSLHILDIVENSIRAEAKLVEIKIAEEEEKDLLTLNIQDDGHGMDPDALKRAADPFYSTKVDKRFGLGLSLLKQATKEAEGTFEIDSHPDSGTRITATFRHSHPDRKPLGDIPLTLQTLVMGNREVDFLFEHREDEKTIRFDTRKVGRL